MGLRDYFGRNESVAIAVFVLVLLSVFGIFYYIQYYGISTVYTNVDVTYSSASDESPVQVTENFDIAVKNNYRVLYRSFEQQFCAVAECSENALGPECRDSCDIIISDVSCTSGTPYIAYSSGVPFDVKTGEPYAVNYDISSRVESMEVGCFDSSGYNSKDVSLQLTYELTRENFELNKGKHVLFSQDHFLIRKLNIKSLDGSTPVISGIPADSYLSIDSQTGRTSGSLKWLYVIFALAVSFFPFVVWRVFGQDKQFTVPEYLHVVPNSKREPWQVDVLTSGGGAISGNGLTALLLSLTVKKVINIEKNGWHGHKILIKQKRAGLSAKEEELVNLFMTKRVAVEKGFDVCEISSHDTNLISPYEQLKSGPSVSSFAKEIYNKVGFGIAAVIYFVTIVVVMFVLSIFSETFIFLSVALMVLGGIMFALIPAQVFGHFNGEYRKEYLEWLAFKNMLTDFAQISKYMKEDHSQWKEWLVYGAALGVASEVIKQIGAQKILDPKEVERLNTVRLSSYALASSMTPRSSGSSGGGSIGGGGGFGGGGGGGR